MGKHHCSANGTDTDYSMHKYLFILRVPTTKYETVEFTDSANFSKQILLLNVFTTNEPCYFDSLILPLSLKTSSNINSIIRMLFELTNGNDVRKKLDNWKDDMRPTILSMKYFSFDSDRSSAYIFMHSERDTHKHIERDSHDKSIIDYAYLWSKNRKAISSKILKWICLQRNNNKNGWCLYWTV